MITRLCLAAGFSLWAAVLCAQPGPAKRKAPALDTSQISHFSRWSFRDDFSHGMAGWMSFPLPQDVGYDPSLYTTAAEGRPPALVRDVMASGERLLRVGLHRDLRFHATPSSSLRVTYDVAACGGKTEGQLTLGSAEGRRFTAPLPAAAGPHVVRVSGQELKLPAAGSDIEGIVLEVDITRPEAGSHNRVTVRALEVEAERPSRVSLEEPELEVSAVDDVAVVRGAITAGRPVTIRLRPGQSARVALSDGAGVLVHAEKVRQAETKPALVFAPPASASPGLWKAVVEGRTGRSEFRFLVLNKVPDHPRVLLTRERLEQLQSEASSNGLAAVLHRRASELRRTLTYNPHAGQNIARLSTVSVFPGLPEYFTLMENYSQTIASNALDYRMSGDPEALAAARRALATVAAWPTWTPPWFSAHGLHTYYEVGVFTQRVALGCDLIADQLTVDEKSRIADAFWRNSIQPTLEEYFFYDRMPIAASNHAANSVGGAIAACVALWGDSPALETRLATALAELVFVFERLLDGLFPGDGSEAEPAGYENFAMEGMSWGGAALQALGTRPRGLEHMFQAFWWIRYAQVKPEMILDTGDFQTRLAALTGYAWSAESARDPALQAFYETATHHTLTGLFRLPHTARTIEEVPGFLDLVCCTKPSYAQRASEGRPAGASAQEGAPPSRIFPLRGSAVLRSGWQPQDTVISLRAGPWFNHEHHDQGSFRVAAWGEEIIAEAGSADYYKDPHYADYFTQAPAHNTVVIDGDVFSQENYGGRYWSAFRNFANFERHVFSSGIDYLSADLAPAYDDGSPLERFTREYLFLKPDVLIVHDRLRARTAHRYTWFLHPPPAAQTQIEGAQGSIRGQSAFVTLVAGVESHRWALEQVPVPTIEYGDLDRNTVSPRKVFRLDSPEAPAAEFLVGLHFQPTTEAPAPLAALRTTTGEGFSFVGAGRETTVLFRTRPGPLAAGGLEADANAFAISAREGVKELFLGQARSLRRGEKPLVRSSQAIDAVLEENDSSDELRVVCPGDTALRVLARGRPVEVLLDRARVTPPLEGETILLDRLAQGEHIVRISY